MKQPDSFDTGTQMDIARYRLQIAREDLDTANLTFASEQYRAANNRAYYSILCGAKYYSDKTARQLEKLVNTAKQLMQEISVINYTKAA